MMIRRIDHIAIAVRNLQAAKGFYLNVLGGRELFSAPDEIHKLRWTTIELGSSCLLELIDPIEEDGFLHRFLQGRGEGPHHITVQVDDILETKRLLEEKGVATFGFSDSVPGWKEMFIHPKDAFGLLIQFAEFNPLDWITEGYVPQAYREFTPSEEISAENEKVEIRPIESDGAEHVELKQGQAAIRIPRKMIRELIKALEKREQEPI